MDFDEAEREGQVEQLLHLLYVMQDMARRLEEQAHGRGYDKARELNELLHRSRRVVQSMRVEPDDKPSGDVSGGVERRRAPRRQFGDLF